MSLVTIAVFGLTTSASASETLTVDRVEPVTQVKNLPAECTKADKKKITVTRVVGDLAGATAGVLIVKAVDGGASTALQVAGGLAGGYAADRIHLENKDCGTVEKTVTIAYNHYSGEKFLFQDTKNNMGAQAKASYSAKN